MESAFNEYKPGPGWQLNVNVSVAYVPEDFPVLTGEYAEDPDDDYYDQENHFICDERWLRIDGEKVLGRTVEFH